MPETVAESAERSPSPAGDGAEYARGFESLTAEVNVDSLPLRGSLPAWLAGSLVRTGPALFEAGEQSFSHWFDGQAMLHRFGFGAGKVSYASRFLRTEAYEAVRGGEIAYSEFATDPCRSLFKRAMTMFNPKLSDNCNVNVGRVGERFIAMTETPIPVEFDAETLATAGVAFEVPGELTTAHPHLDRGSGGMLNYSAKLGPRNKYRFFLLGPDAAEPEVIAELGVDQPAYMHSFGLTENFIVLAEFPFVVNPVRLLLSGRPYIENYRWKPERGTKLTLIDRRSGETRETFTDEPYFAFHHVNAFERDGEVVVDMATYPDPSLIDDLYLKKLRAGAGVPPGKLRRVRLNRTTGELTAEHPLDTDLELARINYGRCNERPYRYVWGLGLGDSRWFERIVRGDLERRASSEWRQPGCYPGEPVFVARPGAEDEDDGVLLSVVLDAASGGSFLLVLDAADLSELARAEAPHHIPFSFHGQFARV